MDSLPTHFGVPEILISRVFRVLLRRSGEWHRMRGAVAFSGWLGAVVMGRCVVDRFHSNLPIEQFRFRNQLKINRLQNRIGKFFPSKNNIHGGTNPFDQPHNFPGTRRIVGYFYPVPSSFRNHRAERFAVFKSDISETLAQQLNVIFDILFLTRLLFSKMSVEQKSISEIIRRFLNITKQFTLSEWISLETRVPTPPSKQS